MPGWRREKIFGLSACDIMHLQVQLMEELWRSWKLVIEERLEICPNHPQQQEREEKDLLKLVLLDDLMTIYIIERLIVPATPSLSDLLTSVEIWPVGLASGVEPPATLPQGLDELC